MKVGIITVYDAVNYGSFLQAYCLQQVLKNLGHDVTFIKTSSKRYQKWRMKSIISKKPKLLFFKLKVYSKFVSAWKLFSVSTNKKGYDAIVIGSDEMWSLNNFTLEPLKEFFGVGLGANKIITYAVSGNNTKPEDIQKYDFIPEGIKKISSISVRDKATYDLYKQYTEKEIVYSLDPTFLLNLSEYVVPFSKTGYIVVYAYDFNEDKIKKAIEFSKAVNKPLISAGHKLPWCHNAVPASPFEFLGLLKGSDYVLTDTFHGTILSIHLKKNFAVYTSQKQKILKVLEQFSLQKRDATSGDKLMDIFSETIDYNQVEELIQKGRMNSIEYLRRNL